MKILITLPLLIFVFVSTVFVEITDAGNNKLSGHKDILSSGDGMFANIKKLAKSGKPKELFGKISGVLKKLGPLKMSISALISNFTMTSVKPKEESPELKAINEGFEKLNERLTYMTSKIGNLENIIELSNSRAAYVQIVSSITHMYETLEETKNENTKEAYGYFKKQYEKSYKFAASNLYDALSGSTGPFGFDMMNLYKNHVKCNPVLLSEFCIMGIHLINQGLSVEGAYLGAIDFHAKIEEKLEVWDKKLNEISRNCESMMSQCESSWKEYAYKQFRDTQETVGGDNQEFAEKLAKDLDKVVPYRSWLAVAYDDASGFEAHCFSSYYDSEKIWDRKGHDVTIFSVPREDTLTGDSYDNLVKLISTQKEQIPKIDCKAQFFWVIQQKSSTIQDARVIADKIREVFREGVVYTISMHNNPGQASTGNTLYASEQRWHCASDNFRLIVFK